MIDDLLLTLAKRAPFRRCKHARNLSGISLEIRLWGDYTSNLSVDSRGRGYTCGLTQRALQRAIVPEVDVLHAERDEIELRRAFLATVWVPYHTIHLENPSV